MSCEVKRAKLIRMSPYGVCGWSLSDILNKSGCLRMVSGNLRISKLESFKNVCPEKLEMLELKVLKVWTFGILKF